MADRNGRATAGVNLPDAIIDAHHHLWDLQACHYPWLMAKGVRRFFGDPTPIQKNYLVEDFLADIGELPVTASVHVQVGVEETQAVAETRWLQAVAESGKGFPQGIVAFCDLAAPEAQATLEAHRGAPNLRGIRQILGRSPEENAATGSHLLLENPVWMKNLAGLAEQGLSFDLQLIPSQLPATRALLAKIPALRTALCHCGSPFQQDQEGLARWKTQLRALAELPNVYCKLSGFGMFDPAWSAASIRPIVLEAIEAFTPERCMFGSNFPVEKLCADYRKVWAAYGALTQDFTAAERRQLFHATARDFYAL